VRSLVKALHTTGEIAPAPWSNLAFYIKPRTGNLMAVAAASGVGKSMFALNWVAKTPGPHLYVSLDTTLDDQAVRLLALTGHLTTEQITEGRDEDPAWAGLWSDHLSSLDTAVRFTDQPTNLKEIKEVVIAETEFFGRSPVVVVVDNVADLLEEEESASEYHRIFGGLRQIARDCNTMVMALHHLRRKPARFGSAEQDQGTKPVMKTDILYGGDREVQYLLGLWRSRPDILSCGVLKNRMGQADPSSNINVRLRADFAKGTVSEDAMLDYARPTPPPPEDDRRKREEWWQR
jgi:hypothetical protein